MERLLKDLKDIYRKVVHFEPFDPKCFVRFLCPPHRVQPHTLYPVCHEAFGIACDASCLLRLNAGSPAIAIRYL